MKTKSKYLFNYLFIFLCIFSVNSLFADGENQSSKMLLSDDVETLKELLISLSEETDHELLALHFQSMLDVIEARGVLNVLDIAFLEAILPTFADPDVNGSASKLESYLNRQRQMTIAWESPTDGAVSYFKMKLPANWDPEKSYPLYIELHGLWDVAANPIDFMTYAYRNGPSSSTTFDDGFLILPWGRGNMWYQGISETDIWEGIDVIEDLVKIDQKRKYITGHSMGGYGAWAIAAKSANVWAGLGIHAGALWYGQDNMLSDDKIESLKDIPTYFVCGNNDGLLNVNQTAYHLLIDAGNQNVEFVTFEGGHDYHSENVKNMYLWLREFENVTNTNFDRIKNADNEIRVFQNPENPEVIFQLHLLKSACVELCINDLHGNKIAMILNNVIVSGDTQVTWDNSLLPKGIYIYSLLINGEKQNGKLIKY